MNMYTTWYFINMADGLVSDLDVIGGTENALEVGDYVL